MGRLFHLGDNKEAFSAEVFSIYQAFRIFDIRQQSGEKYMIFSDYQPAILRAMSGALGPGQHWARAIIEVATRLVANNRSGSYRSRHMLGLREIKEQTEWLRRQPPETECALSQVRLGGRPASLTSPGGPTEGRARARATSQWARDHVRLEHQ